MLVYKYFRISLGIEHEQHDFFAVVATWNGGMGGLPTLEPNTNTNSPACWTYPQLVPIYFFLDLPSDMLLPKKHGHSKIPGLFVLDGCKKIFFFN